MGVWCVGGVLAFASLEGGCQAAPGDLEEPAAEASQELGAADPIGTYNPTTVHDTICLNGGTGACFGFSATGGGYGNLYRHSPAGSNWAAAGFGRGWQSSIRDLVHGRLDNADPDDDDGLYNPTQAGFSDDCGKPTTLTRAPSVLGQANRRIQIAKFNAPLFRAGNSFDFTERENRCDDKYAEPLGGYPPSGAMDEDDVPGESLGDQWTEVKSELDFSGFYEDVSEVVTNGAGVLRHVFHYEYTRAPAAILQFDSKLPDPGQLSSMIASWGPRVTDNSDFKWYWYGQSTQHTLSSRYALPTGDTRYTFLLDRDPADPATPCPSNIDYCTKWPLLIIGTDKLISGPAVGIFYPGSTDLSSTCNANPFRRIRVNTDGTTSVVSEERRLVQMKASLKHAGTATADPLYGYWRGEWTMPFHFEYENMDAPEVVSEGTIYEQFSMEVFILTGTPIQIRDAAIAIANQIASGAIAWGCD